MSDANFPEFRSVPRTGVIYVMKRATELGFTRSSWEWANLWQWSPEVTKLDGSLERITSIKINDNDNEYSPVSWQIKLRKKVADLYNSMYRKDKKSKYTYENVSIAWWWRLALTRIATSIWNVNMWHFIPDYTAYEELLSVFRAFIPIPILLNKENGFKISYDDLKNEILWRWLGVVLLSNPCNPTWQLVYGDELKSLVKLSRDYQCTFIFDEFYSHFIYLNKHNRWDYSLVSSAEYVEDVNKDPILIVDWLTKNWRYPWWRLGWIVWPKKIIESIDSAWSFLDGGPNNPFQESACSLIEPENTIKETKALQKHFSEKRQYMLKELKSLWFEIDGSTEWTFYIWCCLNKLPAPLNNWMSFFEEWLKEKIITVPGIFFDVNPWKRRSNMYARYENYIRVSYGPELSELVRWIAGIKRIINKFVK